MTTKNGKELTTLIIRIALAVIAICGVGYAVSVMVASPGNTFAILNADLPGDVEHNQKDLEKLSDIPKDLALAVQTMETLSDRLLRINRQVKQNTLWLLNLK